MLADRNRHRALEHQALSCCQCHQKCHPSVKQQQDWTLHFFHPCEMPTTILKWKL